MLVVYDEHDHPYINVRHVSQLFGHPNDDAVRRLKLKTVTSDNEDYVDVNILTATTSTRFTRPQLEQLRGRIVSGMVAVEDDDRMVVDEM